MTLRHPTESPAGTFTYQYEPGLDTVPSPSPLVRKIGLPNGASITNTYDDWARLLSTTLKNSGNSVLNYTTFFGQVTDVENTSGTTMLNVGGTSVNMSDVVAVK